MSLAPLDLESLHRKFIAGKPFPHVMVDGFLDEDFALRVAASFPSFERAGELGHCFETVNEHRKVQVPEARHYPEPIGQLHQLLVSPEFLGKLERITGIPSLQADPGMGGGGIHETGPGGRLDVHVDFSYHPEQKYFRRLNLLLYLNPEWRSEWGGEIELWDRDVSRCEQSFAPSSNRCLIFETSEFSYHGVTRVRCPDGMARKSFSVYYYTYEAPPGFDDSFHGTVFRARPKERLKGLVLMPAERIWRRVKHRLRVKH